MVYDSANCITIGRSLREGLLEPSSLLSILRDMTTVIGCTVLHRAGDIFILHHLLKTLPHRRGVRDPDIGRGLHWLGSATWGTIDAVCIHMNISLFEASRRSLYICGAESRP